MLKPLKFVLIVATLLNGIAAEAHWADRNIVSAPTPNSATQATTSDESESKFTLYIYDGILFIKYTKPQELSKGEVVVFNMLGKEVARKKLETIAINQVAVTKQNTCFIIKITYSSKVYTQKLIVTAQ